MAETNWTCHFPALKELDPETQKRLMSAAHVMRVPAGQTVFRGGDRCENYLLVIEGSVRVQMTAESGREIVLYRVGPGQSCILTTACLFSEECYSAEGQTETEVEAVMLPARVFHDELSISDALRRFVFASYSERLTSLMLLVEDVAFGKLDLRLARFLLEYEKDGMLKATHQSLASELGSAREVISRQLKEFERKGYVSRQRGIIMIKNADALRHLVEAHS